MMRIIVALLFASVSVGCSSKDKTTEVPGAVAEDKGPPAVDEAEPNNDTKSAQVLKAASLVKSSFTGGAKADEDWVRFDSAAPVIVRVEGSGVEGVDYSIEAYDSDKNKLVKVAGGAGEAVILPNLTCAPTCLFKVSPSKKDADGAYTLKVTTQEPGPRSEKEPNSRYVDAQPVKIGGAVDGYVAPSEDEDWYAVSTAELAPDQVIAVTLASPPEVKLELAVLRQSDQSPVGLYKASDIGQDIKLRNLSAAVAPETGYFLVVRSSWVSVGGGKSKRLQNAKVAYSLELKAAPGGPNLETEPNDDPAHATLMDLATLPSRTGYLAPKGDVDWFTFKLDQPSIVRAEVTGVDRVNFVLSAIDPARKAEDKDNELAKSDTGDVKEPEAITGVALPAGENFIKVEGAWKKIDDKWVRDYENANDTYTLSLSIKADDGTFEREPNDKADKATPLEVGKTFEGYIHPAKDVDSWKLDVAQTTNVTILLSAVPKLDLSITVRDTSRQNDKGEFEVIGTVDKAKIEGEERLVIPFTPGSYIIEVKEKGRESNALRSYSLQLK